MSLVSLDQFEGVSTILEVSESQLQIYITDKDEIKLETISLDNLEADFISKICMNLTEPYVTMRIMALFRDYNKFLCTQNWAALINSNTKISIGNIWKLVKPAELRSRINDDLPSCIPLYKYVVSNAVYCE